MCPKMSTQGHFCFSLSSENDRRGQDRTSPNLSPVDIKTGGGLQTEEFLLLSK